MDIVCLKAKLKQLFYYRVNDLRLIVSFNYNVYISINRSVEFHYQNRLISLFVKTSYYYLERLTTVGCPFKQKRLIFTFDGKIE